jgi:uncharacterized protein (DUF1684 family)
VNARTFFWIFAVVGISICLFYVVWGSGTEQIYIDEINKAREDKDGFMLNSKNSPFSSSNEPFEGLNYFPPDPNYRIQASITPVSNREVISLNTNDGSTQSYIKYAWAEFDLDNLHNKLLIMEVMEGSDRGSLFLAFADRTSAEETYGAGRYLDVAKVPGAGTITLDFNNAYNPYCAYTDKYTCPFPPKENILKVAIRAGEKTYKEIM